MKKIVAYCPLSNAVKVFSGKWKLFIIVRLIDGPLRYGQIKVDCENISEKMLTNQLKELEEDGIVNRKVYAEVPPKVVYSLTPLGKELLEALVPLYDWGIKNLDNKEVPFILNN
ncbi:helix-turn-helix domain-containing protein [Tenacibaculum sp. 190524A02b]|uniref:HxlR family transcriptional regulator n=1 Tax=Tenacibaculum vairaonense TaxID=3137860 RepID=A0ABM9PKM6_9FLAO